MKYFEGLQDKEAIKKRYKELAKQYHPDLGGDKAIMQAINAQYKACLEGAYQREGKSITEIEELLKNDTQAMQTLAKIILLENVNIELCGMWIWITGQTKDVKDDLKNAGFFWARQKKAWYWRPPEQKYTRKCGSRSLSWIRDRYGSEDIKNTKKHTMIER